MPDTPSVMYVLAVIAVGAPVLLTVALGVTSLGGRPFAESTTSRLVQVTTIAGLLSSLAMLALMLALGTRRVPVEIADWVFIPGSDYHLSIKLAFDRLSVPFVILSFLLCGTISAFTSKYLHREPGFNRFFVLYALFIAGMVVASLADTVETLFVGWELVGLSSAMLVGFFHERPAPVRNGLRVWAVYRASDAALLLASVVLHHLRGHGDFAALLGGTSWPDGTTQLTSQQALLVGLLLLIAAAGKSALVPFSGWLPRAMEGPTPSSAIFYGALSVHLGAFLLLRFGPLLSASPVLSALVVALGLATALYAAVTARVQSDVKSALSYASLTQVGIIVAEIGLGLRYIPLVHILGHACLRTLQFLRAPTLLHDYHNMENALGSELPHVQTIWERLLPSRTRERWYRLALARGYFDVLLSNYVARPFMSVFTWCDRMERRWTDWLAGRQSRESDRVRPWSAELDDLR